MLHSHFVYALSSLGLQHALLCTPLGTLRELLLVCQHHVMPARAVLCVHKPVNAVHGLSAPAGEQEH